MSIITKHYAKQDSKGMFIIYPAFHTIMICKKEFKVFKLGKEYQIVGFGTSFDADKKKHETWSIRTLKDNGKQFPVKKSTIKELYDKEILVEKIY